MNWPRLISAVIASVAALWLIVASSAADIPWHEPGTAELRLSWSARPERIEECRRLTEEEMQARPEHMRQTVECTGRLATYDLSVTVDGATLVTEVVRGGGLRNDRPMYLLRSLAVEPGERRVHVALRRREVVDSASLPDVESAAAAAGDPLASRDAREARMRRERALASLTPVLVLDTALTFEPQRAVVVTYDQEARRLRVLGAINGSR